MTGFLTPDYAERYPEARAELAGLLRDGRLISREEIVEGGVRAFPELLPMVFAGASTGKLILAL
jgi:NADPH-dependent curcumin reductase CurA